MTQGEKDKLINEFYDKYRNSFKFYDTSPKTRQYVELFLDHILELGWGTFNQFNRMIQNLNTDPIAPNSFETHSFETIGSFSFDQGIRRIKKM